MKELQVINEQEVLGKTFRMYGDFENPLFLAKDVAEWIEHSNVSKMVSDADLDETEKQTHRLSTLTNSYNALFLTEDGLYEVLMQSRKPIAKQFKKKVKEILKGLRKGQIQLIPTSYKEAIQHLLIKIEENENLQLENQEMKPKALFADAVETSKDSILIGQLAKLIKQNGHEIGQNRLFQWLRDNGYLMNRGNDYNLPTQKSMELGLMEIKERTYNNPDGSVRITKTTKVTGKGQIYFTNKFMN